jgi:hypothetical protein
MALGYNSGVQGMGSASGMTLQEQLQRLYAMSQALRQQSGFGAQPMQGGMQTGMQSYQPQVQPMQPTPMPQSQGQQQDPMQQMMSMLPMMMMMGKGMPSLGRSGGMQPGMIGTIPGIY